MPQETLYSLGIGSTGVVRSVHADAVIRQRLFDMGIIPNIEVVKERTAALGDPVWIRVGSVQLALRKAEAEAVDIETV